MSKTEAGVIATGALLSSAVGGWAAGVLADRYGRVRILQVTIMWFTVFTFLSGFTNSSCNCCSRVRCRALASVASGRWAPC